MVSWAFRPTALKGDYRIASAASLMKLYLDDGRRASKNGFSFPKREWLVSRGKCSDKSSTSSYCDDFRMGQRGLCLRTCQWNIHYLTAPWLREDADMVAPEVVGEIHARRVADQLLEVDADVIVMNEFGYGDGGQSVSPPGLDVLRSRLEGAGYSIHVAECSFPTAVATRLPVEKVEKFWLDGSRAAVGVTLLLVGEESAVDDVIKDESNTSVTVYGTHLDDLNGSNRLKEAEALIVGLDGSTKERKSNILLVGDFNQQRQEDYSPNEWKSICENKARRGSPEDDGVGSLLRGKQFRCSYDACRDKLRDVACNWTAGDPPPATHWTSTVIDYSYFRGEIGVSGVYVSPSNLSDHRMIITDWRVGEQSALILGNVLTRCSASSLPQQMLGIS